jgi:hypothetical protein
VKRRVQFDSVLRESLFGERGQQKELEDGLEAFECEPK